MTERRYPNLTSYTVRELHERRIVVPTNTDFIDLGQIGDDCVIKAHSKSDPLDSFLEFSYVVPPNSLVERVEGLSMYYHWCENVDILYTPQGILVKPGCMDLQPISRVIARLELWYAREDSWLTENFDCAANTRYPRELALFWIKLLKQAATYEWSKK